MLKKLGAILALLTLACGVALGASQPIFSGYASEYEVYLGEASSLADIRRVDGRGYFFLHNVRGESVELSLAEFKLNELLEEFEAEILFSEQTSDSQIYYAYSPKLKSFKKVNGQRVNLHVVISAERAVIGSPLIFGSF